MQFCYKIPCFVIYAILSQNLLCHDLRSFVWRKIYPKIALVEKNDKHQVWVGDLGEEGEVGEVGEVSEIGKVGEESDLGEVDKVGDRVGVYM